MAKKKSKWFVYYWDDNADKEVKFGCQTYEDAMTKKEQVRKKFGRSARVEMK